MGNDPSDLLVIYIRRCHPISIHHVCLCTFAATLGSLLLHSTLLSIAYQFSLRHNGAGFAETDCLNLIHLKFLLPQDTTALLASSHVILEAAFDLKWGSLKAGDRTIWQTPALCCNNRSNGEYYNWTWLVSNTFPSTVRISKRAGM